MLSITAAAFDVEIHAAVVMSTHFHLVVRVPNQDVSELMHRLDLRLAKAAQVLRRFARGVVWAPGQLSIVELETPQAVIEAIAYAIVNPVAAGLVYRPEDWPGVMTTIEDLFGGRVFSSTHPGFYFSRWWPASARLVLSLPECLRALGVDTARALLEAEVQRLLVEVRAHVKAQGWSVMGAVNARNVSPYREAKSWEAFGARIPHIKAGRGETEARLGAIERLQEFRAEHREAKRRWCAGEREVVFPAGTYWMRVHHGVQVAPFP